MLPATVCPQNRRTAGGSKWISEGSIGNDLTKEKMAEVVSAIQARGQKPQAPVGSLTKNTGQVLGDPPTDLSGPSWGKICSQVSGPGL